MNWQSKGARVVLGSYVNDYGTGKRWLKARAQLIACGNDAFLFMCKCAEEKEKFDGP